MLGVTTSSENSDYVLLFKTWLDCLQAVVALSIKVLTAYFSCASSWWGCGYKSICVGGFHADGMLHRVPQSVKPWYVTRNKCTFFPLPWSMRWWWISLFAQVVCRTNQKYINYISFSELWFHETDMNGFFSERQCECWVQKLIRWGSRQYTLHDSITSVVHRHVNVLCSECGVF